MVVLIIRLVHMCPILPNRTSEFRKKVFCVSDSGESVMCDV